MSLAQKITRSTSTDAVVAAMAAADAPAAPGSERDLAELLTVRRWEAAETNRLNSAHWAKAQGQPINTDLAGSLNTLRARAAHEASNNPMVEGVINTHATDLIGSLGPILCVESEDETYNEALEQVWKEFWDMPDLNGQLAGPDLLRLLVPLWWTKGEHLLQIVSHPEASTDQISLRVLALDPDRLDTDPAKSGDPNVALGVRRTREGRPLAYQIRDPLPVGAFVIDSGHYTEYSADEIIHAYRMVEPGQVRGFPWLTSALQTIADMRDYDAQVLDAARQAADAAVYFYTDHQDAPFIAYQETTQVERRTQRFLPPGYQMAQLTPAQPSASYVEYRRERLRELGRPVAMPLMKILLGAEQHNFSSARMDALNYCRHLEDIQAWLARTTLNRLVAEVAREAMLLVRSGKFLLPPRPARVHYRWTWPKQPQVDPLKEANAERIRMENGTLTYVDALASYGLEEESTIASRQRTNQRLQDAELPPLPRPKNSDPEPDEPEEEIPDEEGQAQKKELAAA